ncbi:MAG: hypothetical protein ABII90_14660 [Bacteroidota bacterium]
MKKVLAIIAIVAFAASFSACKKDYTCSCTVSGLTITAEFLKVKKADAEDSCSSLETTYKIADPNASCSI